MSKSAYLAGILVILLGLVCAGGAGCTCCTCRTGTCASARGSATTCGSGWTTSSISGGGASPWPRSNVTCLGTARPVAGLAGVTAAGDVLGVVNGGVAGDQACLAGLAGSCACPAGLAGDLASPPPASCCGVSRLCCSCTCLSTEARSQPDSVEPGHRLDLQHLSLPAAASLAGIA